MTHNRTCSSPSRLPAKAGDALGPIASRWGGWLALLFVLLVSSAPAYAVNCSDYPGGVIDGFAGAQPPPPPSQLQIDMDCTIKNFPASNPLDTNFSFFTQPGQNDQRWLVIFDNVVHTGQMACNSVAGHIIWFVNGSSTAIQEGCQNLLIPVEKIVKEVPAGQTTAAIGVPFTYTLTIPVLYDAGTGTVLDEFGSPNELHSVTVWDDLNATGADLSYVSHVAYWESTGAPAPHTFMNANGLLTFDNFPIIPAGGQIIIELTVVLDDSPANMVGNQFINTATWDFGRLIDGVFYEPLPGESGISEPLIIAGPDVVVTKSGPAMLNLGQSGDFTLDVQNIGNGDAWNVTITDELPNGPTGGMCDTTPVVQSAQIYEADGITAVPGKGPLIPGTDFSVDYRDAPFCELELTMLTAATTIGPTERLIIVYRTELDADTDTGVSLTNVAGATGWFNGDDTNADRVMTTRTLSDGTPGVLDHEDAHTVVTALSGVFYEKTVEDLTSMANPATTAAPGDRLRYTLRLQTTDSPVNGFVFYDDLGERNATAVFEPGSLTLVPGTLPPGATNNTNPNGGTNGAGILDIGNMNLPPNGEVQIQFEIDLASALLDGTVVENQADLLIGAVKVADSDDPTVNGQADPDVPGDEDPTRVIIQRAPPPALLKANTQATATIGEAFSYRITVPSTPHSADLYDVRILDDLAASAADLAFVDVTKISVPGSWTPVNTGTATNLVIEDPVDGIDIPAGEQAIVDITVVLTDTSTNVAGLQFTNTASYTYNQLNGDPATQLTGDAGMSAAMTVVEPELTLEKSGPPQMRIGVAGTFTLNVHNIGTSPAHSVSLADVLPNTAQGGTCDAAPVQFTAQLFEADGVTPVSPVLTAGSDYTVTWNGDPACTFILETLTPAAAIGADQRLIVTYQTSLDADTQSGAMLTNIAGATEWSSTALPNPLARIYTRTLTDGTVGILDHEDAHTVVEFTPLVIFEKTVMNVTTSENPATVATPGDRLHYTLRVENASDTPISNFSIADELDALNAPAAFQAGTLAVVDIPTGAVSDSDPNGGAAGTGLLDVSNLNLGALGDSFTIEFEVVLAPAIANGTYVLNQSQILVGGFPIALSDDPYVNGAALPNVAGDEDPTQVPIQSAPAFTIEKTSSYLTGDPNVLLAGETLRYTITVQNVGTENATGVTLVDQIPATTTYVAGSTTLNGAALADTPGGSSPLTDGILINAPQDPTPGVMNAAVANNVATITFDVVVDPGAPNGTVISNQGFLSAIDHGIVDQPSDDPRTELADDPTRDVVGNFPLLFAAKSAALEIDAGSPGIVDPGDTLRYTIAIYNNGTVPATLVELIDDVPVNTSYVPNSTTLNGEPVADGGAFPLAAGLPVSSTDLTPPLPGAGEGVLSAGASAVVEFLVQVDGAVPSGTLITNQGVVASYELPNLLTDGDGDPSTGPEPTVVVVGNAQQLTIAKSVAVVGGGPAMAGGVLEYTVTVSNVGAVPALNVLISDNLDAVNPGYLTYVDQSATLNGLPTGVSFAGTTLTADYYTVYGPLPPGQNVILRFRAMLATGIADGTTVTNVGQVYWNDPQQTASASVSIDVGGAPGAGILRGTVWHDADFDDTLGASERLLQSWTVTLLRNDQPIGSILTDVDGNYVMSGVVPNYLNGDRYSLEFNAPGAGASTASLGRADSDFTNGLQRIDDIVVQPGSNVSDLNLPIDPNGVVYDAVLRSPIAGAVVTLVDAQSGTPVPSGCFYDPAQQDQVTLADGYYKFDINFSAGCPSGSAYSIQVVPPGAAYFPGTSALIPSASDGSTPPFDVPGCPGSAQDAIVATNQYCEAQASALAPAASVPARSAGTVYYKHLLLDDSQQPGSAQLFNNHIPLDPILGGAVSITKTTPRVDVTRGELVPYTITLTNTFGADLPNVTVVDRFPAGFHYVEGSARLDGVATEPIIVDRELRWEDLLLTSSNDQTIQLLLAVGAGVGEGEFTNHAFAVNSISGGALSGDATATVRLVPDPTFDCSDVTGKVFDDANRNGYQDPGEDGIAGVRVVTVSGLTATTDTYGRYHFTCAITPHESRGSNIVLKLDDRTLPSGFRLSTSPVKVQRATRGKALRINFGASIHRVVGLDIADPVFEPGTTEMRALWRPRVELLLEELHKAPAILRLSYLADVEDESLVNRRLESLKHEIMRAWKHRDESYELVIEPEIFWRRGGPPEEARVERR
jgi:uncharacterized repeat protein (TIGR01451 family)/fimbrial isopeptide formation D2 family protein